MPTRIGPPALAAAICVLAGAGCGSSHRRTSAPLSAQARPQIASTRSATQTASNQPAKQAAPARVVRRPPPRLISILPAAHRRGLFDWTPAVAVRGRTAVWISRVRRYGEAGFTITLLRFDRQLVTLALHAAGRARRVGLALRGRDRAAGAARRGRGIQRWVPRVVRCGWVPAYGRIGWPCAAAMASVVIYRDGSSTSADGGWCPGAGAGGGGGQAESGAAHRPRPGGVSVDSCMKVCWGDPCTSSRSWPARAWASPPMVAALGGGTQPLRPRAGQRARRMWRRDGDGAGHQPGLGRRLPLSARPPPPAFPLPIPLDARPDGNLRSAPAAVLPRLLHRARAASRLATPGAPASCSVPLSV